MQIGEERRKPECHAAFQVNRCLKDAREAKLAEVRRARALERQAHQLELGVKRRQAAIFWRRFRRERSLHPHHRRSATAHQGAHRTTGFENHPGDTAASRRTLCRAGCSRGVQRHRRPAARRTSEGRSSDTTPGCEATRRSNQRARQRNSGTGSRPCPLRAWRVRPAAAERLSAR